MNGPPSRTAWMITHDVHGGGRIFSTIEAFRALGFTVRCFHEVDYPAAVEDATADSVRELKDRLLFTLQHCRLADFTFASVRRVLAPLLDAPDAPDVPDGWTVEATGEGADHVITLINPSHSIVTNGHFWYIAALDRIFFSNIAADPFLRRLMEAKVASIAREAGANAAADALRAKAGDGVVAGSYDPTRRLGIFGADGTPFAIVDAVLPMPDGVDMAPILRLWPGYASSLPVCLKIRHHLSAAEESGERPDVILVADVPLLALGLALKKRFGCPVVYDAHEWWMWQEKTWAPHETRRIADYDTVERALYPLCDARFTIGHRLAERMEAHCACRFEAIYTCAENEPAGPYGVERDPTFWTSRFGLPAGARVALFVGALSPLRNLETLTRAAGRLAPGQHLVIVGDGSVRRALEEQTASLGTRGTVLFAGHQSPDSLRSFVVNADLGVIPYYAINPYYQCGMPSKFSDYFVARLPMLVDRSMSEYAGIVSSGEIGRCIDCRDEDALGTAMREMLSAPDDLARMRSGYDAVGHLLSFETMKGRLAGVLRQIGVMRD